MGAWGKIIAGSLGAVLGRAVGARGDETTGDGVVETSPPSYEITVERSGPGLEIVMPYTLLQDLPDRAQVLVWLRDGEGRYLASIQPPWADEDGDLVLEAKWQEDDDGDTAWETFLPFVALPDDCPSSVELQTRLIVDDVVLYEELWGIEVPSVEERLEAHLLGAHACAAVRLAAAGTGPDRAHVRATRQVLAARFSLDEYGLEILRRIHKQAAAEKDDPARWLPALEALDENEQLTFASDLLTMARLDEDGYVEPQAQFLFELFERVGFDTSIWDGLLELEDEDEADDEDDEMPLSLEAHFVTLELTPGATWEEVRVAYKRLARDYHPDRVATLPKGFQQFATETMARLNEAYEALRKHFRR